MSSATVGLIGTAAVLIPTVPALLATIIGDSIGILLSGPDAMAAFGWAQVGLRSTMFFRTRLCGLATLSFMGEALKRQSRKGHTIRLPVTAILQADSYTLRTISMVWRRHPRSFKSSVLLATPTRAAVPAVAIARPVPVPVPVSVSISVSITTAVARRVPHAMAGTAPAAR